MKHKIEFNKQEILEALVSHYQLDEATSFNVFVEDESVAAVVEMSSTSLLTKNKATVSVATSCHTSDDAKLLAVAAQIPKHTGYVPPIEADAKPEVAVVTQSESAETGAQPTRRVRRTREQMLADRAEQEAVSNEAVEASLNADDDSLEEVAETVHNQTVEEAQAASEAEQTSLGAAESTPPVRRRRFTRDESVAEAEATTAEPVEQAPVRRLFGRNA